MDPFRIILFNSICDCFSIIVSAFIIDHLGRKPMIKFGFFFGGIFAFLLSFAKNETFYIGLEMPSQEELLRAFHGAAPPLTERGNINYNNPPMSMANLNEQMRNTNKIIVQQEGHKPSKFNLMALQQARDQNPI